MTDAERREYSALIKLRALTKTYTGAKNLRICAICLEETPRATYDDHMRAHGYESLNIGPADAK